MLSSLFAQNNENEKMILFPISVIWNYCTTLGGGVLSKGPFGENPKKIRWIFFSSVSKKCSGFQNPA
jgi:hypothetical protein